MRDDLKAIDLDSNNHVAFIEFLLFTFKRTTAQMFTAKPSDHLVAKLEAAIAQYKAVFEEKKKKVRSVVWSETKKSFPSVCRACLFFFLPYPNTIFCACFVVLTKRSD